MNVITLSTVDGNCAYKPAPSALNIGWYMANSTECSTGKALWSINTSTSDGCKKAVNIAVCCGLSASCVYILVTPLCIIQKNQ